MSYPPYPQQPAQHPAQHPWQYPGQYPQHTAPPGYHQPGQPGYPPPGYLAVAPRRFEPSTGLAIGAVVCAGIVTLAEVVEARLAFSAGEVYANAASSGTPVDAIFTGYDIASMLWAPAMLAAYVISCLWLWKVRKNADAFLSHPGAHTRRRGWIWAGWLVPIVQLWFPFQIVRDIRGASAPPYSSNSLIGWWWAAWLAAVLTTDVGSRLVPAFGQASEGRANALGPVETLSAGLCVLAFVLWCLVVKTIVREQDSAAAAL